MRTAILRIVGCVISSQTQSSLPEGCNADVLRSDLKIVVHRDRRVVAELHRFIDRLVPRQRAQRWRGQVVVRPTKNLQLQQNVGVTPVIL